MALRLSIKEFELTYHSWQAFMQRCVYRGHRKDHKRYRGRGITACRRWHRFENFVADMGPRTDAKLSLDRFPNKDGNYEPGNCRWATAREQAANRSSSVLLTFKGETCPRSEWARRTGLAAWTIALRIKQGWSVRKTLSTPANARNAGYKTFAQGRLAGKKLVRADVVAMVRRARTGMVTATALGKEYGVSPAAVCHIMGQYNIKFKKGRPRKLRTS